jgi:hypothetical protein
MPVKLWYEKLKPEHVLFLTQKLLEGKTSVKEIAELFHIRFPKAQSIQFEPIDLEVWASEKLTGWKATESESTEGISLAEEVEKETQGVTSEHDLLNSEDQKKINMISKHRRLLLENWENYMRLKEGESPNETAKQGYLKSVSEELKLLTDLEAKEKSLLSMLEEVKSAEEKETAEQFRDYIEGYCLQKIAFKLNDVKKIKKQFDLLKERISLFEEIMEEYPSIEEGVRIFLQKIYTIPVSPD